MGIGEFMRLWLLVWQCCVWACVTIWLGAVTGVRCVFFLVALPDVVGRKLHCARGHTTDAYGIFACRCGALIEDHAFARCGVCRQPGAYLPCPTCGLPIRNRLLRAT